MAESKNPRLEGKKVALGVTGCIAAYKACDLASRLTQTGAVVRVIMTEAARRFVSPLSFSALSRQPVYSELFTSPPRHDPAHVSLAEWADIFVIAPATANIIGKIACGIADDLLSCCVLAAKRPLLVAPAMNANMYQNRVVQENIEKLKRLGVHFVGPDEGYLACGAKGPGRLASVKDIIAAMERLA